MNQMDNPSGRKSYFCRLPTEALVLVVRHLSDRPRNPNWWKWLKPSDVHALFIAGGSIAFAFRSALESSRDRRAVSVDASCGNIYWQLLRVAGPVFTDLALTGSWPESIDDIRRIFSNVRCLRISTDLVRDKFDSVLRACRGNLKQLGLEGKVLQKEHVTAVSTHCAGLESLRFDYIQTVVSLNTVWPTVGPSLKSLSFRHLFWGRSEEVQQALWSGISWFCSKLTSLTICNKLTIMGSSPHWAAIVGLCKRLGKRLQVLSVPNAEAGFGSRNLRTILATCPNVVVDIVMYSWDLETLEMMKGKARKLVVHTGGGWNWDLLEEASRELTRLEQLEAVVHTGAIAGHFFASLFSTPKASMRELVLCYEVYDRITDFQEMYRVLANLVSTLEVFECWNVPVEHCAIQLVVEANPGLRSIRIEFANPELLLTDEMGSFEVIEENDYSACSAEEVAWERARQEEAAVAVLNLVSRCPSLQEVSIRSDFLSARSPRLADACVVLRRREIDVFVAGIQYAV